MLLLFMLHLRQPFSELSYRVSAQATFLSGETSNHPVNHYYGISMHYTGNREDNATVTPLHKYLSISEESYGRETEKV